MATQAGIAKSIALQGQGTPLFEGAAPILERAGQRYAQQQQYQQQQALQKQKEDQADYERNLDAQNKLFVKMKTDSEILPQHQK
ncbi:hypothetical protein ACI3PL_27370, partial [Lacticaseibacillus paracasei]